MPERRIRVLGIVGDVRDAEGQTVEAVLVSYLAGGKSSSKAIDIREKPFDDRSLLFEGPESVKPVGEG